MSEFIVNDCGETEVGEDVATVTISRSLVDNPSKCSDPFMDITCEFHWLEERGDWLLAVSVDEDGNDVRLTDAELLLASSMVRSGVNETGV
jgi:hypothetical protein